MVSASRSRMVPPHVRPPASGKRPMGRAQGEAWATATAMA